MIYAKAELARLRRQPAEEERNIAKIAEFKPEDLSPVLLGRAGDYLLGKGKWDQAKPFYDYLMEDYPKSDYLDYAYNGLGEIAFQKKDLQTALRDFTDGTNKIAASTKMKELTVGQGKTLLALDRLDEAKKVFEQVASVREWRGRIDRLQRLFVRRNRSETPALGRSQRLFPARLCWLSEVPAVGGEGLYPER